jgi:hypothetical protein
MDASRQYARRCEDSAAQVGATVTQPDPQPGRSVVADRVLADIHERAAVGKARYGTPLMTHNGRDALTDAYEEALDLVFYLRQALMERDGE